MKEKAWEVTEIEKKKCLFLYNIGLFYKDYCLKMEYFFIISELELTSPIKTHKLSLGTGFYDICDIENIILLG